MRKIPLMFTIDQIKAAHAKVKSGADFPKYVQDLIQLGIKEYSNYVADGHIVYTGTDGHELTSDARYPLKEVAAQGNREQFARYLKAHQQGQTDYPAFCSHSAETGVDKWVVDMDAMSCTYYDKAGNTILTEAIPVPR